jgi:hypothetical protein
LAKTVKMSPACMAPCFIWVVMLFFDTKYLYFPFECNLTLSVRWNNNCRFENLTSLFYFVKWPTNAQLIDKLSHSTYMFRHYCFILREFVVSTLPSYTITSNAIVGNII